ncbi:putative like-Sm (LSM) domain containing protein, LSm4/SmD1/SmD3 [Helianthus annuus]|nr:putative like-Sm (LSM) domain containing protein, LSm4/SmD1/SmD3 [Helianthus annuus]
MLAAMFSGRHTVSKDPEKDGKVAQLEHVFIRGSKVRFMIIPDMLKNAPMFKCLEARIKGKGSSLGVGRGRAVPMQARVSITITFNNIIIT